MKILIFAILIIGTIASCDDCKNDDCPPSGAELSFQVIDSAGNDFYSNAANSFKKSNLKIQSLVGSETDEVPFRFQNDTVVVVKLDATIERYKILYSENAIDTLSLNYISLNDKCCETEIKDFDLLVNGDPQCSGCFGKIVRIVK